MGPEVSETIPEAKKIQVETKTGTVVTKGTADNKSQKTEKEI